MSPEKYTPTLPPHQKEVHLLDYFVVLAKHSRLILYTTGVFTLVAALLLYLIPDKYKATARILPPQQNLTLSSQVLETLTGFVPGNTNSGPGIGGAAASFLGLKSPADLYVGILTSNSIFDRIIQRFELRKVYRRNYIEDVRAILDKNTLIEVNDKGLITIDVIDTDRHRAMAMANAFVEEMDKLLQEMGAQEANDRMVLFEKERLKASQALTAAEESLKDFSEQEGVIQIDSQTKAALEYIANLRATIDAKEVQIKVMRQQATPYNYDIIRLETEVKGLQEKLRAAETKWEKTFGSEVCLPTAKTPALGLQYLRLYREMKFQETLYQMFSKLVEMAKIDAVRDVAVIQVVDKAVLPEQKSSPKRLLITILVSMTSFLFMICYVFWKEYWQYIINQDSSRQRIELLYYHLEPWSNHIKSIRNLFKKIFRS